ncbi:PulJ/GspJ family protein [Aquimarina sp. 2201CG5-10]|uniref:PulJ/GspJ family protein n=1 Tax=Aquimarina callyspongiae TaxID=3098150 RepID=UPI002AB3B6D8|nr:prepilin-type N-terminal cleavage/methylation domain-containing protein [Aquimarina sp. 2201CG5-10]MDY8138466.1 prepilin-type N-terminal cleavage/methylation domain-containing protein [Aquimarina sp. 2201CG5-10]
MNKVKAFTILEMLVNLTIMSIIMGLIYFAYSSFVQQVMNYQRSIDEENELTRSYVQLKTDFYNAERVVKGYKMFKTIAYNNQEIEYKITDKYLIRKQLQVYDTLPVSSIGIESEFNQITKEDLINKLVVKTMLFEEPLEFTVIKEYAPNFKLKQL